MRSYPYLGSFESTKIHGTEHDVLSTTRHLMLWERDLDLLYNTGVRHLRYSIPWHRIERVPGTYDWSWMDGPMRYLEEHRMQPIVDPLHHTSFPDWLTDGFAHPAFPELYERFLEQFAGRYPWVEEYTIFNEPLPTTLFCSYTGLWYPHRTSDDDFVQMAAQVCRAICRNAQMLRRKNPRIRLVHIDTCEHHQALDRRSEEWVEYANWRRFLMHDLVLGRVNRSHPLCRYVKRHGLTDDDLRWFQDNASSFDVLGLDYYFHSEIDWFWSDEKGRADIHFPPSNPRGFASVAQDYIARYKRPILLSETNIRGTIFDRITWLKFMDDQCQQLIRQGADFRGFCWYPSIDSTDWCHCVARCTKSVDPQGLWLLDRSRWERRCTELSDLFTMLVQGKITGNDLPAYYFQPPLDRDMRGYVRLMEHWPDWREPGQTEQVA